ncbi:hypothetical protein OPKNFCMD_4842 [Methylobacterium crusticola]|uniref:Uncharacterized protein n=1 Tax=Methylobacterium crusticola TaxID=1697972 RepID=A0ABQ4R326_9HYPH|nr:hypothetical protein [Methylobacterium crusticola]GJD52080.1 hypothetical protein OPKNFCMD_4842 [Methylobacterium crusticola]
MITRPLILLAGLVPTLLAPSPAPAQERLPAPALRCGEVAAVVTRRGAVLVGTGPFTYARLVRDTGFCTIEETTRPFFGPSADAPQCFLGYECRDRFNEGRDRN